MTDLRQAAQQALEALQNCANHEDDVLLTRDALAALRTALEQQAEPVMINGLTEAETNATASVVGLTKQAEPVAYFDFQEFKFRWAKPMKIGFVPVSIKVEPLKLYSEAPQRQWVGLTHEQTKDCLKAWDENDAYALCRAIEAKLKERNT